MDTFRDILAALVPGLIIAVVASLVTVRLSLRSFYSEKWWERKADAYSAIVESLYNMKAYVEAYRDAIGQGKDFRRDTTNEVVRKAAEGRDQVFRAAAIGSFIISNEAADSLGHLRDELVRQVEPGSLFTELDEHAGIVTRHLQQIRELAKKDLNVK